MEQSYTHFFHLYSFQGHDTWPRSSASYMHVHAYCKSTQVSSLYQACLSTCTYVYSTYIRIWTHTLTYSMCVSSNTVHASTHKSTYPSLTHILTHRKAYITYTPWYPSGCVISPSQLGSQFLSHAKTSAEGSSLSGQFVCTQRPHKEWTQSTETLHICTYVRTLHLCNMYCTTNNIIYTCMYSTPHTTSVLQCMYTHTSVSHTYIQLHTRYTHMYQMLAHAGSHSKNHLRDFGFLTMYAGYSTKAAIPPIWAAWNAVHWYRPATNDCRSCRGSRDKAK